MSNLSQFFGGGSVPIGGLVVMPNALPHVTIDGKEYLRAGLLKAYDASYAAAVAAAPQLRVFHEAATSLASQSGSYTMRYHHIGSNYVATTGNAVPNYSSNLTSWSAATGLGGAPGNLDRYAVNGTSYLVVPHGSANYAHYYTANGSSYSAVGGTFTTHPVSKAVCYGNSWWVALNDLAGTAGGRSTINNANPSGTWTIAAAPSLGGTAAGVNAIAFGGSGNWFVACGASASLTAGKLATCTNPSGTWTDRTNTCGINAGAYSLGINDVVFDGNKFVAVVSRNNTAEVWHAADPTGSWTYAGPMPYSAAGKDFLAETMSNDNPSLVTDGAGKLWVYAPTNTGPEAKTIYESSDSGLTWTVFQGTTLGATATNGDYRTLSYANGKLIANFSGSATGQSDLGALTTPAYVGVQQPSAYKDYYVRIK